MAQRSESEQRAYDFGRKCRRDGLTLQQTDIVARADGLSDPTDAITDGWYAADESPTRCGDSRS